MTQSEIGEIKRSAHETVAATGVAAVLASLP
jgi:hypothetical protein